MQDKTGFHKTKEANQTSTMSLKIHVEEWHQDL